MDFEAAAQRLARDQSKARGRKPVTVSAKAKREAEYRKKQQERMRDERLRQQRHLEFLQSYYKQCDRMLHVKSLEPKSSTGSLQLTASSIHGDGDKIALPPSILEFLTQSSDSGGAGLMGSASPWTFRIGILNTDYNFPASPILNVMKEPDEDDSMHDHDDDEDEGHDTGRSSKEAYLDELAHKFVAYTHGTVVEFTQDEGNVGLPASIAAALLDSKRRRKEISTMAIPVTRTVDPSSASNDATKTDTTDGTNDNDVAPMEIENNDGEEKTPGHVAWGAFDVPAVPIEITMVQLPKGTGCTLVPTREAVQNGFYGLKDVKLVLEQSLIRTRATLTVGDTVHTWHRGVKFDLTVSKVIPSTYGAVTCINTDIEVDIGEVEGGDQRSQQPDNTQTEQTEQESNGYTLSGGRILGSQDGTANTEAMKTASSKKMEADLLPEPPAEQKEGVCTIQIRAEGVPPARRRLDCNNATLNDLFAFASSVVGLESTAFQLVTRFPRKMYTQGNAHDGKLKLADAGIQPGQEQFMVEQL